MHQLGAGVANRSTNIQRPDEIERIGHGNVETRSRPVPTKFGVFRRAQGDDVATPSKCSAEKRYLTLSTTESSLVGNKE